MMMPIYMDSYPHQRNQMHFPQYYYPSFGNNIPPHMMVDHSKPHVMYEAWPHGNNYGYSMPCHGCCNRCNFPGYNGFRPTFSHVSPASPFHYCGHNPPFPEPYPVHYAPPPHQAMEHQRNEYDKDAHRDHHCCGCTSHVSNQKTDKGVKIEEQEPDVAKKSDSLVPIQSKNYSYPIVWIPPEYMKKNDEHRSPLEFEAAGQEKVPLDTESDESMKTSDGKPKEWNGWFPLDVNSLKSVMQGEVEKRKQNQRNENDLRQLSHPIVWMPSNNEKREPERKYQRKGKTWLPLDMDKSLIQGEDDKRIDDQQNDNTMRQFPYPIFWMPFQTEQGEAEKKDQREMNDDRMSTEEQPSGFRFMQMKPPESDDIMKNFEMNKENRGGQAKCCQMMEGSASQKFIPVKQVEADREDNSHSTEKKDAANNSSRTSKKRQSLSPPKTSKLPPVCLKLEPLSRKKNNNSNSRSPSPPSLKRQSQEDTPKPSASSSLKEKTPPGFRSADVSLNTSIDVDPNKVERKAINVVDGKTCENKNEYLKNGSHTEDSIKLSIGSQKDVTGKSLIEGGQDTGGCDPIQNKGVRCEKDLTAEWATEENKTTDATEAVNGESKAKKKNLSDVQAAVLVQSAYRGFEVRKLEPLKKLKQMAEVRQQVAEIRNRIQALESDSDLQKNDQERLVIGEMIMRLLLKLDTIQGLHPSIRETRKALANDLVTLQEELDSLMMKSKEVTVAKIANNSGINVFGYAEMQEMRNQFVQNIENSSEMSHDNAVNIKEQDQGKLSSTVDPILNSQGEETSEPASLGDKKVLGRCEHEVRELPGINREESQVGESASDMVQDKASYGGVDVSQPVVTEIRKEDNTHSQLQLPATSSDELTVAQLQDSYDDPKAVNVAKVDGVNGGVHVEDNLEVESTELPLKLIDEEACVPGLGNDESAREGKSEIVDGEVKSHMLAGPTLPCIVDNMDDIGKAASNVDPEANLVAELPIGVLEEDLAVENKQSETEPETNLVAELPVGVLEEDLAIENKESETENLVGELPAGVLEDHKALTQEQCETERNKVISSREASYDVATKTTLPTESENLVMVDELLGSAVLKTEDGPPLSSIEGEVRSHELHVNEEKYSGRADIDKIPSPIRELEVTKENVQQQVVDGNKEDEVMEKEQHCRELESIDRDKRDETNESEITAEDIVTATPASQMPTNGKESATKSNRKLIEENVELREMMERLMEAGKEQLTVISQLTGRVKDLERKLSRKKKLRTPKRYKQKGNTTFR